jgi:type II secretory pathway pseudopilin PulG
MRPLFCPITPREYNKSMDNTGQLINYIVQELKRGVPEASIRSALLQNGWPAEPVNRAFSILGHGEPATPVAAELPEISDKQPASSPIQLPKERSEPEPQKSRSVRRALVVIVLLALLGAVGIFWFIASRPSSPAEIDAARKATLNTLADRLSDYYTANDTYPTLAELNSSRFVSTEKGFAVADYRDPVWKGENAACKDKEGRAKLLASRAKGCFGYRVTAGNGDDCNAKSQKCTRVVLTATLESDKPLIVALDQNKKEKH